MEMYYDKTNACVSLSSQCTVLSACVQKLYDMAVIILVADNVLDISRLFCQDLNI